MLCGLSNFSKCRTLVLLLYKQGKSIQNYCQTQFTPWSWLEGYATELKSFRLHCKLWIMMRLIPDFHNSRLF